MTDKCDCGEFETPVHFFFVCHKYESIRPGLLTGLSMISEFSYNVYNERYNNNLYRKIIKYLKEGKHATFVRSLLAEFIESSHRFS